MPRRNWKKDKAARARAGKHPQESNSDSETDDCHWDGTEGDKVPQFIPSISHPEYEESFNSTEWDCEDGSLPEEDQSASSDSDRDLQGAELLASFASAAATYEATTGTGYEEITEPKSKKTWTAAEKKLRGKYTGSSDRKERRDNKSLRDKEAHDAVSRVSSSATMFTNIFKVLPRTLITPPEAPSPIPSPLVIPGPAEVTSLASALPAPAAQQSTAASTAAVILADDIFTGYISDILLADASSDPELGEGYNSNKNSNAETSLSVAPGPQQSTSTHRVRSPPALKRQKFDVPQVERRKIESHKAAAACANILASALADIDKLIASRKEVFHAGNASLQSYRARSIQSHLHMVVNNKRPWKLASETAAEAQGFARNWGSRMVRKWTRAWISDRVLPQSQIGKHGKSFSFYDDPTIRAELRSYVRSEKWAMDPAKLVEFSQKKMVPAAADNYLRHITDQEMPTGLKKYMELVLFPRISFKVGRGVSLQTARHLLKREGFSYMEHKKGL
ncbi:hypothetical protein C8J57DRAFT_1494266 [Mycena rebaudengoi]|nr:hypothetical protein C8J57DRAFT_1494266 [Mycena rebaudengoi]